MSASLPITKPESALVATCKCRLCGCRLGGEEIDDVELALCGSCKARPEARRLGLQVVNQQAGKRQVPAALQSARSFTDAEKALIRKVHGFMPPSQLLGILNERLACDLGPDAMPYTIDQLHAEIGDAVVSAGAGSMDWPSLRKLLAQARRSGVLGRITAQLIDDFAVVYSLNAKQVMSLKDILLKAKEES